MIDSNDLIIVNDLTVAYKEKPVLWDIDVEIPWVDKSKVLESENDNHFDDGSDEVQIDFEWNDNSEQPDENGKDWK